jgi:hypothetical protein
VRGTPIIKKKDMDIEKEKAIIDAINTWEMGFLRGDEMVELLCELDTKIGEKVLDRLKRIKASDEYLQILKDFEDRIDALILKDEGIFALINYHRLVNLKG